MIIFNIVKQDRISILKHSVEVQTGKITSVKIFEMFVSKSSKSS